MYFLNLRSKRNTFLCLAILFSTLTVFGQNLSLESAEREANRKVYEQNTLQQYESLPFFDIPWRVLFNDEQLSFLAIKSFFEEKLGADNIDLATADRKLLARWKMYNNVMRSKQTRDGTFRFQDQVLKDIREHRKLPSVSKSNNANFQFIAQENSTFYTNNGRIERVNFHPTNTNIIWASAPEGGLWKSTDAGGSFTQVDDFWEHLSVGDLVYDPLNSNILYLATDDHDSWFNSNRGVLKSTDGGDTWAIVGLPNSQATNIYKLMSHPAGGKLYACTNQGLFESTDGGVNWTQNAALPTNVNDLEFHPTNNDILYATTRGGASPNTGYFYVSTNGGMSFSQQTATLDSKGRTTQVCVSPNDPDVAYVGVYPEPPSYTNRGGMIMKYTHSTTNISTILEPNTTLPGIWVGGAWDFRIEVDPSDADHIIYGSVFNFETTDGGANWTRLGSPHADVHDIKWQAGTNRLWIADDGGVGYSTDGGTNWTTIRDIPVMQFYSVFSNKDGSVKMMGAQDAGVHVDHGGFWFQPTGGDGLEVKIDPVDDNILYGSIQNGITIDRVEYNPTTQTYTKSQIMNKTIAGGVDATWRQKIVIHPEDRNILYTNYRDVFKTTNAGQSWTNISNGGLGNGTTAIEYLYQSQSNPDIMIAGWSSNIKKSTDGGVTWNSITSPGFNIGNQNQLVIHPDNPDIMWASSWANVRKTTDGGASWTDYSGTLPWSIGWLVIDHQEGTNGGVYVAGRYGEVYYRDNTMMDWELFNTNIPNVWIREIEALPHENKVRVATWGRGVWESPARVNSTNLCSQPLPPQLTSQSCGGSQDINITQSTPNGYDIYWYKDGVEINGERGTTLTVTGDGIYRARYRATSGSCDSYYSDNIDIVTRPAVITNGGEAMNFDGDDDYISVPAGQVSLSNEPFTVEFWAKRNSQEYWDFMLTLGNWQVNNHLMIGYNGSRDLIFTFFTSWQNDFALSGSQIDFDWHHFAFVFDPNIGGNAHNRFIYMDGKVAASDRFDDVFTAGGELKIGRLTSTDHYHGSMDELRIWKKALTASEIQAGMFCPPDCITSDLLLYLPMEDGTANGNNSGISNLADYANGNATVDVNNFSLDGSSSNFINSINYTLFNDNDGDGYGSSSNASCGNTNTFVFNDLDINDNNANINPTASESCNNSDDNGNGIADENSLYLALDGIDDELNLGNSVGNFGAADFTLEFRFKTSVKDHFIISKRELCGLDNFWNLFVRTNGRLRFEMCQNTSGTNYSVTDGNTDITDGQWHHVAVTRSNGNISFYLDGEADGQGYGATDINNTTDLVVGTNICNQFGTGSFNGEIDELRFWNKALSSVEIGLYKNATLPATLPNLTNYYDFNNANATGGQNNSGEVTAMDRTSNNNGTLINFALSGNNSNWLGSACTVALAINTLEFVGYKTETANNLYWQLAENGDIQSFTIERSEDGLNNWESLQIVTVSSSIDQQYAYQDYQPYSISYYRLRAVNSIGKVDYSKVLVINRITDKNIKATPNPTSGEVKVSFYTEVQNQAQFLLYNAIGQLVQSIDMLPQQGQNEQMIFLQDLPNGVYTLVLKQQNQRETVRILKQE